MMFETQMNPHPANSSPPLKTLLWRGWCKKCPQCGEGPLYHRWLRLYDNCPKCGLKYLPDQGDLFGPLLFLDRALFLIPLIVIFFFRPWNLNLTAALILAGILLGLLVFTMPNRNGLSLAFDYHLRRKGGDLAGKNPPGKK